MALHPSGAHIAKYPARAKHSRKNKRYAFEPPTANHIVAWKGHGRGIFTFSPCYGQVLFAILICLASRFFSLPIGRCSTAPSGSYRMTPGRACQLISHRNGLGDGVQLDPLRGPATTGVKRGVGRGVRVPWSLARCSSSKAYRWPVKTWVLSGAPAAGTESTMRGGMRRGVNDRNGGREIP